MTKTDEPLSLGQRVEIMRIKKRISRTELARRLGLSRTAPAKWAAGESAPRDIEAVAAALRTSVALIYAARPEDLTALSEKRQRRAAA